MSGIELEQDKYGTYLVIPIQPSGITYSMVEVNPADVLAFVREVTDGTYDTLLGVDFPRRTMCEWITASAHDGGDGTA